MTLRRLMIRWRLVALTPDDLSALLDRSKDESLGWRQRFRALVDYVAFTKTDEQIEALLDSFRAKALASGIQEDGERDN